MRRPMVEAALAAAVLAGCGNAAPVAEVGGGVRSFEPIADGATVEVVCGPQGGQHIWTSLRTQGVGPDHVTVTLSIVDPDTHEPMCEQELADLLLTSEGDWSSFTGVACFVPDPAKVEGKTLLLTGKAVDAAGVTVTDARRIVPYGPGRDCRR